MRKFKYHTINLKIQLTSLTIKLQMIQIQKI